MPKKNKTKTKKKLSPAERLLRSKADTFIRAEKEFWKKRYEFEDQYNITAKFLSLDEKHTIPENLASIVWGLTDGVAFVRYQTDEVNRGSVEFRAAQISLEQWGNEGLFVPTKKGEFSLAQTGFIRGLSSITFEKITFNEVEIPYVAITHARYGTEDILEPQENAIVDFQLSLLGSQINTSVPTEITSSDHNDSIIKTLEEHASIFESLLETAIKEEELQIFLKNHPHLLHVSAKVIPKKKLGEDFVTDFVLLSPSDQGTTYYLVEIEKANHHVMTKDNSLSSATRHALKQTRDWDIWLEKNKAYLQAKLPDFETPQYIVIIGRSNEMSDESKEYLRSYNREWKNTELLTYDDVLVKFRSVIESLKVAESHII